MTENPIVERFLNKLIDSIDIDQTSECEIEQDRKLKKYLFELEFVEFMDKHGGSAEEFSKVQEEFEKTYKIGFLTSSDLVEIYVTSYPVLIKYVPYPSDLMKLSVIKKKFENILDIEVNSGDTQTLSYIANYMLLIKPDVYGPEHKRASKILNGSR